MTHNSFKVGKSYKLSINFKKMSNASEKAQQDL